MDQLTHNKIVSFIWGIADDVLRDLFRRGKCPDVILPMWVLRRLDAVLEPTKQAVLETKQFLDSNGITEQHAALCAASGDKAFYNTSKFTLRDLKSLASQQQLLADFEHYLNGFSANETDADLRDTEQVPLLESGGIEAFIEREVLPYTSDAWIDESSTKIGYEISFTRHFYKPQPLHTLEEIRRDILAVQKEAEGLIEEIVREPVTA